MRFVQHSIRPAYALFVIAHGLAHAVLPMRGLLDPVSLQADAMPAILYGVAFAGFLVAGIGILSVRPFTAVARPVLVVSAVWSLAAIYRLGDTGLWPGAAIDVGLLVAGLTGAFQQMPEPHAHEHGLKHALALVLAVGFLAYATSSGVLWTRFIVRSNMGDPNAPAWAAALNVMTFELPHFIKKLAEGV